MELSSSVGLTKVKRDTESVKRQFNTHRYQQQRK